MIGLERRWNSEKGEWEIGTEYRDDYQHPGVTADLKEYTKYNDDGSWAAGYRKINEDAAKEKTEATRYLKIELPETQTKATGNLSTGHTVKYENVGYSVDPFIKSSYKQIDYKFNEGQYLGELKAYIDSTYDQHYSQNQFQATEFIIDSGHGTGFCIGNVLKYAQRYGRKGTPDDWRKDLMKVIHYAVIQLHVHDLENSKGDKNNE